jgi:predicted flap endonuclease-1-like 5' DNA nuclease
MLISLEAADVEGMTVVAVENDLAELKGIGPKHAAMLKEIGVDSIKELRHRNAAKLKEMIESRHGKVVGLSENTVQTWIDEAKAHQM